jgi:cobalt-zinc-cadmium efflux system outer membrane protein
VAESRHREAELGAARRDLVAQVSQEVRVAYAGAVTALQQVVWIRDQLLPEAQQAYRIASTSYSLGGSSALEVLDAKRTLLDAQSQYTDALGAVNDAAAQLQLAVGAPLDDASTGGPK